MYLNNYVHCSEVVKTQQLSKLQKINFGLKMKYHGPSLSPGYFLPNIYPKTVPTGEGTGDSTYRIMLEEKLVIDFMFLKNHCSLRFL